MRPEIEKGIQICIEAINDENSKGDGVFVLDILRQLSKEPYQGSGFGIGRVLNGDRASWKDMLLWLGEDSKEIEDSLDWENALVMLFDWEKLNAEQMLEYAQKITDVIIYNHVLEHIIEHLTAIDDISKAQEYTLRFFRPYEIEEFVKYTDAQEYGYRVILRYYAQKSDTDNFFKTLKLCKPRVDKNEIDIAKILLLESVCKNEGIESAIKLCHHKNIGERFYFNALNIPAENGEYSALKQLFEKFPEWKQPEKETELHILSIAYMEANEKNKEVPDDFEMLFKRAIQVDAKLKWGASRVRDVILFNLGLASCKNKERLLRCRKTIKNNFVKKELNDIVSNKEIQNE